MQSGPSRRKAIIDNVQWFLGALVVAIIIWLLAVTSQNPVVQWRLPQSVPVRLEPDPGMLIVNQEVLSRTAVVTLRGPSSVQELMTPDDVIVYGDLAGLPPGTHTVPLQAEVALNAVVEAISPSQLTVVLELQSAQYVPVRESISQPPPADVQIGSISFDVLQAEVSGPQSLVQQVVAAEAPLDLAGQRASFETDVRLIPVDVDGDEVQGVAVTPPSAHATVSISQRDNVREFNVRPQLEGSLPEGYFISSLTYTPTTVYLSGPSETLQALPSTVFTAAIDLSSQRSNFEVVVPVELTSDAVVPVSQSNITVSVGVAAQTGNEQLDDVPVELVGRREGLTYTVDPELVTLVITGPQPVVDALTASDVQVTADVSAYTTPGNYRTSLNVVLPVGVTGATVTVLPADVTVVVEQAPEVTAEP
ncbi:MAG: CdaR family protein [Anaerolineae bacterium]